MGHPARSAQISNPNKAHARNARARVAQDGTPAERKKAKAAVKKKYPSIGKESKKS